MVNMTQYGTIEYERRQTDLEAAYYLSNNPLASTSVSSAREQVQLNGQPHLRFITNKKASPKHLKSRDPVFFDILQRELKDSQRHHCLFLCWENGDDDQRAIPLLIQDPKDEKSIYQNLSRALYERRGRWWRYFPFYGVTGLEEVEFRFLRKHENDFSIHVDELDISKIEEQLKNELEQAENSIARITDRFSFTIPCYEEVTDGSWMHECPECLAATEPNIMCPFQCRQECERKLDRLRLLFLPLLCFQDPEKAIDQRTLEGMAQESCIYRTSDIICNPRFNPRIAEQKYRGIKVHWGKKWKPKRLNTCAIAMVIVILWKVTGGNWEAAFAAGGFYIMLVSLSPRLHK